MWNLPGPGAEPLLPALSGGFLTTGPPGNPPAWHSEAMKSVLGSLLACLVTQLCPTLFSLMDCSPPGSSFSWDSPGKNTRVSSPSFLQGIFPVQGWNLSLLHCRQILYHLSHQGSLRSLFAISLSCTWCLIIYYTHFHLCIISLSPHVHGTTLFCLCRTSSGLALPNSAWMEMEFHNKAPSICPITAWSESCSVVSSSLRPHGIVHGILQARILEWVAVPFSRGSSQSRDQTQASEYCMLSY